MNHPVKPVKSQAAMIRKNFGGSEYDFRLEMIEYQLERIAFALEAHFNIPAIPDNQDSD